MQKNYIFEFSGSKDELCNMITTKFPQQYLEYYVKDYIIKLEDDQICFGIERSGHSGGNWFIPTITEFDDRIELCGKIQYIGPQYKRNKLQKITDCIGYALMFVLLFPIITVLWFYRFIVLNKILKQPKPQTTEEKLFDLMENHLNCTRKI